MSFNRHDIPAKLFEVIKNESLGIFVGAGLSKASGLPDWRGLLEELIREVEKLPKNLINSITDYKKLVKEQDTNKLLLLAEDLKTELAKNYEDYLMERFNDTKLKPSVVQEKLFNIKINFIITTNYDNLLERAYVRIKGDIPTTLTYTQSRGIAANLWNKNFFILKAHGDVKTNVEEIILTELDYREVIYKERGYQSALQVLFSTNSILFLGTSFSDPELLLLLRFLHHSYHGGGPTHYILLNKTEVLATESKRYMHDFNMHTILYDPHDNYIEVEEFVDFLAAP
jgi:hypothetical protein